MRAFVVVSSLLAACRAEAGLPLAAGYGYAGVAPYASYGAIAAAHNTYGLNLAAPIAAAPLLKAAPIAAAPLLKAGPIATPAVVKAAPIVEATPAVTVKAAAVPVQAPAVPSVSSSQYRAGDELGNHAFGYSNINSARQESGNAEAGVVSGSYSYVDEAGVHTRNYVADAYGFRVTGDNLPVAPVAIHRRRRSVIAPLGYAGVQTIVPSAYTANIVPATYNTAINAIDAVVPASYAAVNNVAAVAPVNNVATVVPTNYAAVAPLNTVAAVAPTNYAAVAPAAYGAAVVNSAPAAREAILTTIKLNPGHATAYRVD